MRLCRRPQASGLTDCWMAIGCCWPPDVALHYGQASVGNAVDDMLTLKIIEVKGCKLKGFGVWGLGFGVWGLEIGRAHV